MKTTLLQIMLKKEKKHWGRVRQMFSKFGNWFSKLTFGVIVAVILIIVHYFMTAMATFWELLLFVCANKMFKANLQKMALKV
jgi:hypothetical protein